MPTLFARYGRRTVAYHEVLIRGELFFRRLLSDSLLSSSEADSPVPDTTLSDCT